MKTYELDREQAVCYTANYKDFDGDVEKWREAYFHLLGWKNTWEIPFEMNICSHRDHTPYLFLVIPKRNEEATDSMLEDLGYTFKKNDCTVGVFSPDIDDDIDFWYFA